MKRAFTLVELLTVIAIIGILGALLLPLANSMRQQARMGREIAAARTAITGYLLYANDHDGRLLPGYANEPVRDRTGTEVEWPTNARYPLRLAPYLDHQLRDVLYVNDQAAYFDSIVYDSATSPAALNYSLSLYPTFGLNQYFVGGHYQIGEHHGVSPLRRLEDDGHGGRLIVFLSAEWTRADTDGRGYFQVNSPTFPSRWPTHYSEGSLPQQFGYVAPRWNGRAVAAMLGGNVELLDIPQLRDMRLWSHEAAAADDPDWRP